MDREFQVEKNSTKNRMDRMQRHPQGIQEISLPEGKKKICVLEKWFTYCHAKDSGLTG